MKNNTLIFGDSYSTFEGFIPEGYAIYYTDKHENPETDVSKVSQTWWYQVIKEANLNLILNNSWSGSTIGYTGYNNADRSQSSSFIYRLKQLIANGFFMENQIDKVFIFGGTNDNWADAPLGEAKYKDWTHEDLYFVLPAICYFLNLMKETVPQAEIYCLINTNLKPEIVACMQEASKKYGITAITFKTIDKMHEHPTKKGMIDIKDAVLNVLKKN